jgi:hypothetical protein
MTTLFGSARIVKATRPFGLRINHLNTCNCSQCLDEAAARRKAGLLLLSDEEREILEQLDAEDPAGAIEDDPAD